MKNKFYASLFVWIGLTVAATPSLAKATLPPVKKQTAKPSKATAHTVVSSKKSEPHAAKKPLPQASAKQKNQPVVVAKDSKHGKTKFQQHADAKDSKHGKTKAQQLADTKDSKHGKTKAQQLADAKNSKHKTKAQQLADAKNSKHGKNHHVSKRQEEEIEEDTATDETATDEQTQATDDSNSVDDSLAIEQTTPHNAAVDSIYSSNNNPFGLSSTKPNNQTDNHTPPAISFSKLSDSTHQGSNASNETGKSNTLPVIAAPTKSNLFFTPQASNTPPPVASHSPLTVNSDDESNEEENKPVQPLTNNERVHSLIAGGTATSHQVIPIDSQRVHSSIASRSSNNFIDNTTNNETTRRVASAHGVVDGSLTSAGEKVGLSNDMVIQMTDVFAWDIDFANNLQEGDQFTVIYEEAGVGNKANSNQIVAAQFINRGKTYTAIRYKDKEGMIGYYTPDGRSLRKAFLTTPIDFARVSSPFDPHRKHPILNRIRAHKGVDYAARTGTPVKAAGDGVVTFHGNKGAYGRMIVLSHGEHYETAYAHLSNFRDDLQDGEPVKQGDVIGYVGQSGLATGPHLHYEFRVDGEHRDPEKLDSKQAMRLPNGVWEDFHAQTIPVLTQLNQAKAGTLVAKNP